MNENSVHYDMERLRAVSIRNVASQFGTVKRYGSTYKTLCPWHEDHDPSLSLVERTGENYCHCFSCDKGGDVIAYVMAAMNTDFRGACEWLSRQYSILTTSTPTHISRARQNSVTEAEAESAHDYIPMEMLDGLVSVENSLCQCLMKLFLSQKVEWIAEEYLIGSYELNGHDNCTVFPNIDYNGQVCNLKVQWYDTDITSPRFAHSQKGLCYWLASMWKNEKRLPRTAHYTTKTLFGEHLLPKYPAQTVALVESPKNALVGALEHPEMIWLATGNKNSLKRHHLQPLSGRNIIVIPDRDAISQWKELVATMSDVANFCVSDFCEQVAPVDKPKYDIADYIIDKRLREISGRQRDI